MARRVSHLGEDYASLGLKFPLIETRGTEGPKRLTPF